MGRVMIVKFDGVSKFFPICFVSFYLVSSLFVHIVGSMKGLRVWRSECLFCWCDCSQCWKFSNRSLRLLLFMNHLEGTQIHDDNILFRRTTQNVGKIPGKAESRHNQLVKHWMHHAFDIKIHWRIIFLAFDNSIWKECEQKKWEQ